MSNEVYDFIIIGSGLGGLECAYILSSEGFKVLVLEKNRQLGGSLQVFSRNKHIFDTGVHYIGGLDEGQNMNQFFKYFGVMDRVKFKKLDNEGFDRIKFKGDDKYYFYNQGYEKFKKQLIKDFPKEENAINTYCDKIVSITKEFPMYNIDKSLDPNYYTKDYLSLDTYEYISSITDNITLRNVLSGTKMLYGGKKDETPLYVHALVVNSYIESAYRCIDGGSRIAVHLAKSIKKFGGKIITNANVINSTFNDSKEMTSVLLEDGKEFFANKFISNIPPSQTIDLVGKDKFKNAYVNRIKKLKTTISSFSLHLTFKDEALEYMNHNIYYFKDKDVWNAAEYKEENWPTSCLVSMPVSKKTDKFSNVMSVISYMNYEEVKPWEKTFNTDSIKNDRGESYKEWKKNKENQLIDLLEKELFPGIKDKIIDTESSTPLTYRDYIGNSNGAMYGTAKDYKSPIKTFINTRTKVPNLFLTGQYLNLHGVLGVTVSAFITCFEFLDREKLINKVKTAK